MRIVVVGTGTGVGKTHASSALLRALVGRGEPATGLKPIETGFAELAPGDSDGERLAAASDPRPSGAPPVRLAAPLTPWLAAELEGTIVDLDACARWVDAQHAPTLVIESAGGLLSPLSIDATNLELARALRPDALVLVAVDRLGVLHEVAACKLALERARDLPTAWVLLQAPERADQSTGRNAALLERLGHGPVVGTLPRGASDAPEVVACAAPVVARLLGDAR